MMGDENNDITAQWLVNGGDERITPAPDSGLNKYGFSPFAEPGVPAYGSSTASAISPAAFAAVDRLRARLQDATPRNSAYATEIRRLRDELRRCLGTDAADIVFCDSGTTAHLIAAQLVAATRDDRPVAIVMMTPAETGRGVPAGLSGRHFGQTTPHGGPVTAGDSIDPGSIMPVTAIALRTENGTPRATHTISSETAQAVTAFLSTDHHVLLNTVDCSKTGMIAPDLESVAALKRRYPHSLDILVDACQYRLAPATLRYYLESGFMVAVTGSKFMAGPSFSGALLIPDTMAHAMRDAPLPATLGAYSAQADWPDEWRGRDALPDQPNYGALLRWEAAMVEMRTFHTLPEDAVKAFFDTVGAAVQDRLAHDPAFAALPVPAIDRAPLKNQSWDICQTIFPFLLRRPDGTYLSRDETRRVYEHAGKGIGPQARCRVGQPVECGERAGQPVSALRLCLSAPLAVDALAPGGRGQEQVIAEALSVLDNMARRAAE